jgi:hypothetical protein
MSKAKRKQWTEIGFKGEWAETLQKFLSKQQDEVPPGWITGENALKKMRLLGHCSGQRTKLLQRMTEEGFLEKKIYRVFDGSGRRVTPIAHYKLAKVS